MDIIEYRNNKKIKILLIEDEVILSKIYADILSNQGYKVLISKNGTSGVNKYNENKIDLIMVDLMLPDMSGIDVLEKIKKSNKNVKAIVITNISNENIYNECLNLGVLSYLVKSDYTPVQILDEVKTALNA